MRLVQRDARDEPEAGGVVVALLQLADGEALDFFEVPLVGEGEDGGPVADGEVVQGVGPVDGGGKGWLVVRNLRGGRGDARVVEDPEELGKVL